MLRLLLAHPPVDGHVEITGDELHHLHTRRLAVGDRLLGFDESGIEHELVLVTLTPRQARARVERSTRAPRESPLDLALAPALLKGRKLDLVIEKATELGVRRIAPFTSRFIVGQGDHTDRWRRLAVAAAKQSGRTRVPAVDAPRPFAELLALPWPGLRLIAWEGEATRRLTDVVTAPVAAAVVVVGPEGGFADDEMAAARAAGFQPISLGPRILRAETASIAAVALCQHRLGDA